MIWGHYFYFAKNGEYIALGNVELKPAIAQNYDIYASVYQNHIGLFTFGYFYKEVDDLITPFSFRTLDEERINNTVDLHPSKLTSVSTWINLEAQSYVKGFEVDWQTNFWYLPSFLRGLVLNINYTEIQSHRHFENYQFWT